MDEYLRIVIIPTNAIELSLLNDVHLKITMVI